MAATTNNVFLIKQHLIGKICFIEEKYSNKKLAIFALFPANYETDFQIIYIQAVWFFI